MAIFGIAEVFGLKGEMARSRAKSAELGNEQAIASYAERFEAAGIDRTAFERILTEVKSDKGLKAADVISIAYRYNKGGVKPPSKAMALAMISKRFVEIVRFHAKNEIAAKARPW